jgi:hypothetical protein
LTKATTITLTLQGQAVKFFSSEWSFREKILSQHGRKGSMKGLQDVGDVIEMLRIARPGAPEMDFSGREDMVEALKSFLRKRPEARSLMAEKVKCYVVLGQQRFRGVCSSLPLLCNMVVLREHKRRISHCKGRPLLTIGISLPEPRRF